MKCPECKNSHSKVLDSRTKRFSTQRWRRHECTLCRFRFNTMECYAGKNLMWNQAVNEALSRIRSMKKKD